MLLVKSPEPEDAPAVPGATPALFVPNAVVVPVTFPGPVGAVLLAPPNKPPGRLLAPAVDPKEKFDGLAPVEPKRPPVAGLLPNKPFSCVVEAALLFAPKRPPEVAGAAGFPNNPPV